MLFPLHHGARLLQHHQRKQRIGGSLRVFLRVQCHYNVLNSVLPSQSAPLHPCFLQASLITEGEKANAWWGRGKGSYWDVSLGHDKLNIYSSRIGHTAYVEFIDVIASLRSQEPAFCWECVHFNMFGHGG